DGNTGPYAQYTYARCCSLLEKAEGDAAVATETEMTAEETELARTLAVFPERINEALSSYEPSTVTRYVLDLCAAFNRFYHECQILSCDDPTQRANRLAMTKAVKTVLGTALHLICLSTPENI
ncbi:MAG: arginine--tRNA ligase, partial [Clostridia bacterium]|nr:arginine--tRNA ligase [Clostridia bacterium]